MVAAAVVGTVGALGGAYMASSSAKSAAKTQADAAAQAGQQEWAIYQQNREDLAPYREQGTKALSQLGDLTGTSGNTSAPGYGSLTKTFSNADFQEDPGYNFRLSEGQKALDRSLASKGGLLSGAAVKALTDYNQNAASDEYGAAYSRFTNNQNGIYNKLSGLAGTGQTATNTTVNDATTTGGNMADLTTSAANARAAGQVGAANAWSTGLNSATSGISDIYQTQSLLKLLGK